MGADKTWGIGVNDVFALWNDAFLGGLLDHHRDVIADDFRKARGVYGDDFRIVNGEDVGQSLGQIC